MKKILLCSAAIVGVAFAAAPAMAQVDVTVGGHTKNYFGWADNEDSARDFDMVRESELHFNAEGTADNGVTYGFHAELEADGGDDATTIEESYLYLASSLGRLNLGSEDGAAYLLQVAAPSGDANVDGLRQYINPFNTESAALDAFLNADGLDYDNDATGTSEKFTYLSPNWNGLQFGASYTPGIDADADDESASAATTSSPNDGFADDDDDSFFEGAVRYEGTFNNVGFAVGAGYGEGEGDDLMEWNVGADFDIGAFGVGAAYTEAESEVGGADQETDTIVVGADYTTGPFQFGASYLNKDADDLIEADRYAAGVVYTMTQGLTLRGSVQFLDADIDGATDDEDSTAVLGGVQFNF
jgi:outer membrane protein OmpU